MRPSARIRSRTAEAQPARHELLGRRHAEVVAVVLEPLAHLDDVAMAFGRQEAQAGALAFEQRVGRDGRAVHDPVGLREQRGAVEARRWPAGEAVEHAERGVLRRRGHFCERRRAVASIATRSVNVPPTSMPMRYMACPHPNPPPLAGEGMSASRTASGLPPPQAGEGWVGVSGAGPSASAMICNTPSRF